MMKYTSFPWYRAGICTLGMENRGEVAAHDTIFEDSYRFENGQRRGVPDRSLRLFDQGPR